MFVTRKHDGYVEVSIVLSDGTTIGTGYGPSLETAAYFACKHAARSTMYFSCYKVAPGPIAFTAWST